MVAKSFMFMIYICFGIYGLSTSLIGSIWPEMSKEIGIDASFIGIILTLTSVASGVSGFVTYKIRQKLGSNYTSILGLALYAVSMILYMRARSVVELIIAPIILGFANGIIDVNSNSYVVKAYDAKWVSFMHAVWGISAALAPVFMTFALLHTPTYRNAYSFTFIIIIIAIVILFIMKQSWLKKRELLDKEVLDLHSVTEEEKASDVKPIEVLKEKRVLPTLLCFAFSNGSGSAIMAWIATIVVAQKAVSVVAAATAAATYSLALTFGRICMGVVAEKMGTSKILKFLSLLGAIATAALFIPYKDPMIMYVNVAIIGFAAGPLTPLLNSDLKEKFDVKILSVLISLGGVFGLLGIAAISSLMTIASNAISINYVQIIPAIGFALLFITYSSVKNHNS